MTLNEKYTEVINQHKIIGNACMKAIGILSKNKDNSIEMNLFDDYVEKFKLLDSTHHQYKRILRYLESQKSDMEAEYLSYEWMYNYIIQDLIKKYNQDSDKYNLNSVIFNIDITNDNYVKSNPCLTNHHFPVVNKLHAKDCYNYLDKNLNYQSNRSNTEKINNILISVSEDIPLFININLEKINCRVN